MRLKARFVHTFKREEKTTMEKAFTNIEVPALML